MARKDGNNINLKRMKITFAKRDKMFYVLFLFKQKFVSPSVLLISAFAVKFLQKKLNVYRFPYLEPWP